MVHTTIKHTSGSIGYLIKNGHVFLIWMDMNHTNILVKTILTYIIVAIYVGVASKINHYLKMS